MAAIPDLWMSKAELAISEGEDRAQISIIDISRAYFNAKPKDANPVYVEFLPEDPDFGIGLCGKLNVFMYGTRAAADGWHCEYSDTLEEIGFAMGQSTACVFAHGERRIVSSVHGDDFTTVGTNRELDWFKTQLAIKYELKETRIGPGANDEKEVKRGQDSQPHCQMDSGRPGVRSGPQACGEISSRTWAGRMSAGWHTGSQTKPRGYIHR